MVYKKCIFWKSEDLSPNPGFVTSHKEDNFSGLWFFQLSIKVNNRSNYKSICFIILFFYMIIDIEIITNYHVLYKLLLLNITFFPESIYSKGMFYVQINQIVCKYSSRRRSSDILKRLRSLSELFLLLIAYKYSSTFQYCSTY